MEQSEFDEILQKLELHEKSEWLVVVSMDIMEINGLFWERAVKHPQIVKI